MDVGGEREQDENKINLIEERLKKKERAQGK